MPCHLARLAKHNIHPCLHPQRHRMQWPHRQPITCDNTRYRKSAPLCLAGGGAVNISVVGPTLLGAGTTMRSRRGGMDSARSSMRSPSRMRARAASWIRRSSRASATRSSASAAVSAALLRSSAALLRSSAAMRPAKSPSAGGSGSGPGLGGEGGPGSGPRRRCRRWRAGRGLRGRRCRGLRRLRDALNPFDAVRVALGREPARGLAGRRRVGRGLGGYCIKRNAIGKVGEQRMIGVYAKQLIVPQLQPFQRRQLVEDAGRKGSQAIAAQPQPFQRRQLVEDAGRKGSQAIAL